MKHFVHWTTKPLNKYGGYIKTYSAGAIVQLLREEDVFRPLPKILTHLQSVSLAS